MNADGAPSEHLASLVGYRKPILFVPLMGVWLTKTCFSGFHQRSPSHLLRPLYRLRENCADLKILLGWFDQEHRDRLCRTFVPTGCPIPVKDSQMMMRIAVMCIQDRRVLILQRWTSSLWKMPTWMCCDPSLLVLGFAAVWRSMSWRKKLWLSERSFDLFLVVVIYATTMKQKVPEMSFLQRRETLARVLYHLLGIQGH